MNQTITIVRGVVNPDGTLQLDEHPSMPAGPVEVTIRVLPAKDRSENWWDVLQQSRADREASGHRFRSKEEIDADMEDLRSWNEDRIDEVYRQNEANRPPAESA